MPVRDRADELSEAALEAEKKAAEAQEKETREQNIEEVPEDTAEIENKEVAEAEDLAKEQESESLEPLTTGEMHELQEYIALIENGSKIKNKDLRPYERKNGQFVLEFEGNGGRGQVTNPKMFPYLIDEFKRQYEEDPKKFAKVKPPPEPNLGAKAPTITPSQAVRDQVMPLLPQRADQPVLAGAIDKANWWISALYEIGMNATMVALNVAKLDVAKMPELISSFQDKDAFVKHVLDHSIALVQAAGDVQALQKLQEMHKADVVKIEMLMMDLEEDERTKNELVRQVQMCVESMCQQDLQNFSTKRILANAAVNSGIIFPSTGGLPLSSLNNGRSEPNIMNAPTNGGPASVPIYTIKDGILVQIKG